MKMQISIETALNHEKNVKIYFTLMCKSKQNNAIIIWLGDNLPRILQQDLSQNLLIWHFKSKIDFAVNKRLVITNKRDLRDTQKKSQNQG